MATAYPDHLTKIDSLERSVLVLALESGHSMSPVTDSYYCRGEGRLEQCIQKLVEKNASAVCLRDPKTQLFPFQIAATMEERIFDMLALDNTYYRPDNRRAGDKWSENYHSEIEKKMKDEAHLACLNTVYFLLRSDPSRALPSKVSPQSPVTQSGTAKRKWQCTIL